MIRFSESGTDEEVTRYYEQVLYDLRLTSKHVCVCVVGRKSSFNYCGRDLLEKYISRAVRVRKSVLSRNDISEILKIYGVPMDADSLYYLDFSNTGLFKKIKEVVARHGQSIDDDSVNLICRAKPKQVAVLKDLGIPDAGLRCVLDLLYSSENECPVVSENRLPSDIGVVEKTVVPGRHESAAKVLRGIVFFLAVLLLGCVVVAMVFGRLFDDWKLLDLLYMFGRKFFGGM